MITTPTNPFTLSPEHQQLANALAQIHGKLRVATERSGTHYYVFCPSCLEEDGEDELPHGQFEEMFNNGEVKISIRTAQRLMRIASHGVLAKTNNFSFLPPTVATLYLLSGVNETILQSAIDLGKISPCMKIADARALLPKSAVTENEGKTDDPGVVISTYTDRDLEVTFGRVIKTLDKELQQIPDDKSRLRLCHKLVSRLLIKMTSITGQKTA